MLAEQVHEQLLSVDDTEKPHGSKGKVASIMTATWQQPCSWKLLEILDDKPVKLQMSVLPAANGV